MNLFDYIKYKSVDLDCEAELIKLPKKLLLDYYNSLALSIRPGMVPYSVLTTRNMYNIANFGIKWDTEKHPAKRVVFIRVLNQYYEENSDDESV